MTGSLIDPQYRSPQNDTTQHNKGLYKISLLFETHSLSSIMIFYSDWKVIPSAVQCSQLWNRMVRKQEACNTKPVPWMAIECIWAEVHFL